MKDHKGKLRELMASNPRLTSREYAQLAIEQSIYDEVDAEELMLRDAQKQVRSLVRSSKSDPQLAFVSILRDDGEGGKEEIYTPSAQCTQTEAQNVLDNYGEQIVGLTERAKAFHALWTGQPFNYQLSLPFG